MADELLSWDDLADLIAKMKPEDRLKPVLSQNSETGAYFGFKGIGRTDEEDTVPDYPVLEDDNNWFYLDKKGQPQRSHEEPDWEQLQQDDLGMDITVEMHFGGPSYFYPHTTLGREFLKNVGTRQQDGWYQVKEVQAGTLIDDCDEQKLIWRHGRRKK